MRVAIQGDGHAAVAEHLGHDLRVHAGGEQQRRGRVPQVVVDDYQILTF
jgi:hypothetical protein